MYVRENNAKLLFLLFFGLGSGFALSLGLCLGLFHGFLGFGDLLGSRFGALFFFLVENLLAAEEFKEGLVGAVALVPVRADDARVAAFSVAEAWADLVEQLHDGFVGH